MRIVVVAPLAAEENSEGGQACKVWADLMRRNMDLVKQKDTELTFRFPRWGLTGFPPFFYNYLHHLADREVLHAIVQAEKDGFDASIIACFHDPMLRDIRQAVDIPVLSLGESSMLLALLMGGKFGVVSIGSQAASQYEENILRYGLKERAAGARPIPESPEEQMEALTNAHPGITAFKKAAKELIANGADVLIPGCGLMAPSLRLAPGGEKEFPNGVTDVDGASIVDVMGAAVKLAETLVALKQAGSSWISRKGVYIQPTPEAKEHGEMVLKYDGPGFWDY